MYYTAYLILSIAKNISNFSDVWLVKSVGGCNGKLLLIWQKFINSWDTLYCANYKYCFAPALGHEILSFLSAISRWRRAQVLDYIRQLQEACRELATAIVPLIDGFLPFMLNLSIIHLHEINVMLFVIIVFLLTQLLHILPTCLLSRIRVFNWSLDLVVSVSR